MTNQKTMYEKIAELAVEHSQKFYAKETECNRFAFEFGKRLTVFLGADPSSVTHSTPSICATKESKYHGKPVENAVNKCTYNDKDGFWYFAINIEFKIASTAQYWDNNVFSFGLHPKNSIMVIRHSKDFEVPKDFGDGRAIEQCFQQLCDDAISDYERFISEEPKPTIGFGASPMTSETIT